MPNGGPSLSTQMNGRCSPLQKLTLSFCNIGAGGAGSLAQAITPTEPPSGKSALQPKLTYLDLQVSLFVWQPAQALLDHCVLLCL